MKIAIAGFGLEGRSNYEYFKKKFPDAEITIFDQNAELDNVPSGAETVLADDAFEQIKDFDLVVRTAGLPPRRIAQTDKHWSATREFFAECPAPIIGVTGTKGKGTTSSLITGILRASGYTVHLVGNIGVPALGALAYIQSDDIVVFELSSFQLWDVERSPHIGVVLMIEPDHLDKHESYEDYISAKANISRHQSEGDICYFYPDSDDSRAVASGGGGRKVPYISQEGVHIYKDGFYNGEQFLCSTSTMQIIGKHNQENACAALSVCLNFDGVTAETISKGLSSFSGLPHRLEFVAEKHGVRFYDDSFSSATPATVVAVKAMIRPTILIVGGFDRGLDYTHMAESLAQNSNLKQVIAIGETASRIAKGLNDVGYNNVEITGEKTMRGIVAAALSYAQNGDAVLLSPGCASFDMFENFSDRGNKFQEAVEQL